MTIIEHTPTGTTVLDTDRSMAPLLKAAGFRWSGRQGLWYLNSTWGANTRLHRARMAHKSLTDAGHEVTLEVETGPAVTVAEDVAAIFEAQQERGEARAERLATYADRREDESEAAHARAQEMASVIPFGQPILVDHYSAGRDRRYRDRIQSTYVRSFRAAEEAEDLARRSETAAARVASRSTLRYALRKVEQFETERRKTERLLTGQGQVAPAATGSYRERLIERAVEQDAHIAFWKGKVAEREAAGEKVWTRADFKPGDWAQIKGREWMQVVKANPKTLALETGVMPWPLKYDYSDVTGKREAVAADTA